MCIDYAFFFFKKIIKMERMNNKRQVYFLYFTHTLNLFALKSIQIIRLIIYFYYWKI